jgi:WXXGXW repeat (2 copies)
MSPRQSKIRAACRALALTMGLTVGAAGIPQWASASEGIVTNTPPPPNRGEHAPPPRDGYVWGGGHWEWNSRSYVWVSGTWLVQRRAAHWIVDRWEQVGAQWHYVPGHWER